jgi:3-hydroxybutyryl-CoA dehydrogenase
LSAGARQNIEREKKVVKMSEITNVGIVGAGTMGSRIACQCVLCGKEVYLFDAAPQALERGVEKNQKWINERVDAAQAKKALSRLHPCESLADCVANVDLILENVPENLEIKRQVFAEIDRLAPPHVLIGTNSSSIPPSRIADATNRPDKFFNANFSPPAVEVMGHAGTSEETLVTVEAFLVSIEMVPLRIKREIMGYAFNRTWRTVKREILHLVADGYADFENLDRAWMLNFGSPCGPFGLMDEIGLDVVRDIEMQYYLDSGDDRDKPPVFLDKMIAHGRLGVKSGQGFYTYPDPEYSRPGWLRKEPPWMPEQTIQLD